MTTPARDEPEDAFSPWRTEGREQVRLNAIEFDRQLQQAEHLEHCHRDKEALVASCLCAYHANFQHGGVFTSPRLEHLLFSIGRRRVPSSSWNRTGDTVEKVLHVATHVGAYDAGGIPRMIRRWILQDESRTHSLALTRQAPDAIPDLIRQPVLDSGGSIHLLNTAPGGLAGHSRALRTIAADYDIVILHVWEMDVVPTVAFANKEHTPPVVYVNYGDHWFWLGAGVADAVANLRATGATLSLARRGIPPERNGLLPIVMEPLVRRYSRTEAKRMLEIPEDSILLLSIARGPKYHTIDGCSFARAHLDLLLRHPRALLVIVGAGPRPDWSEEIEATAGRIRPLEQTPETGPWYQAADIYVDSYPFPSNTSLLEAGSYGLPLVSRFPFSDACGVMGADMPGFSDHLQRVATPEAYLEVLDRLVQDAAYRSSLGESTREAIVREHSGEGWQHRLEELYRLALSLPRHAPPPSQPDEVGLGEPDVFLPRIHGSNHDPDWACRFYLGAMPFRQRIRNWWRLGSKTGARLPFSLLLPEPLYCRWAQFRHGRRQ